MTRTVSPAGRAALMAREGCRLAAYRDSVGVPTIGVGHTGRAGPPPVAMGMTITRAEAESIFAADLAPFEGAVGRAVAMPVTQNQFDALVSLAFNIGARGFAGSAVVHRLADGDQSGAADAFLMWEHPPELASRRRAERAQFLRPDTDPPEIAALQPVPHINKLGVVPPGGLDVGGGTAVVVSKPTEVTVTIAPPLAATPLPPAAPGFWARLAARLTRKDG